MAGAAVVSSGSHAHAAAEFTVLPVPATLHRTLREPSRSAANGRQLVEFVEREREPALDPVADEEERGGPGMSRGRRRGR